MHSQAGKEAGTHARTTRHSQLQRPMNALAIIIQNVQTHTAHATAVEYYSTLYGSSLTRTRAAHTPNTVVQHTTAQTESVRLWVEIFVGGTIAVSMVFTIQSMKWTM